MRIDSSILPTIGRSAAKDYNRGEMPRGFWWIVEIAALVGYILIPLLTFSNDSGLPATIPIHVEVAGTPDASRDEGDIDGIPGISGLGDGGNGDGCARRTGRRCAAAICFRPDVDDRPRNV